jgi:hypothetical protein
MLLYQAREPRAIEGEYHELLSAMAPILLKFFAW